MEFSSSLSLFLFKWICCIWVSFAFAFPFSFSFINLCLLPYSLFSIFTKPLSLSLLLLSFSLCFSISNQGTCLCCLDFTVFPSGFLFFSSLLTSLHPSLLLLHVEFSFSLLYPILIMITLLDFSSLLGTCFLTESDHLSIYLFVPLFFNFCMSISFVSLSESIVDSVSFCDFFIEHDI